MPPTGRAVGGRSFVFCWASNINALKTFSLLIVRLEALSASLSRARDPAPGRSHPLKPSLNLSPRGSPGGPPTPEHTQLIVSEVIKHPEEAPLFTPPPLPVPIDNHGLFTREAKRPNSLPELLLREQLSISSSPREMTPWCAHRAGDPSEERADWALSSVEEAYPTALCPDRSLGRDKEVLGRPAQSILCMRRALACIPDEASSSEADEYRASERREYLDE